jgi:hypothetical protein
MLVVKQRQEGKVQDTQDKETCTDEVQSKRKKKNRAGVGMFVFCVE